MGITNNFKIFINNVKESLNKKYLKVVDAKNDATRAAIDSAVADTPRKTGNLVSNWNLNLDFPDMSYTERKKKELLSLNESIIAAKKEAFFKKRIGAKNVYISNAAPYAKKIDDKRGMSLNAMDNLKFVFRSKTGQGG
jgi:hypothetical protein